MFLQKRKKGFKILAFLVAFLIVFQPMQYGVMAASSSNEETIAQAETGTTSLVTYPAPRNNELTDMYAVKVRSQGADDAAWENVAVYYTQVQNIVRRPAAFAYFDCSGPVEVSVTCNSEATLTSAQVSPVSKNITPEFDASSKTMTFTVEEPSMLSVEPNGNVSNSLHLFVNSLENEQDLDFTGKNVVRIKNGDNTQASYDADVIYVEAGYYQQEFQLKDNQTMYLAGGAVVNGCVNLDGIENASLIGRGVLYRPSSRAMSVDCSKNIYIEGIIVSEYGYRDNGGCFINIGNSENVTVKNVKGIARNKWSDGIDVFTSENVTIKDCFVRSGDDCIAIYGPRPNGGHLYWGKNGNVKNVRVSGCVLMPDKAHSINIGTHGDFSSPNGGRSLDDLEFKNIDILTYDEEDRSYSLPIGFSVSDGNKLTNVLFEDIRMQNSVVDEIISMTAGRNAYSSGVGHGIDNVYFKDISYTTPNLDNINSPIKGYNANCMVKNVTFENLKINDQVVTNATDGKFSIGNYVENVKFVKSGEANYQYNESIVPEDIWPDYYDYAKNKIATADGWTEGHGPAGANDGLDDTAWMAENENSGHWLQLDLGEERKISGGIRITWKESKVFYRYSIQTSMDGENWTTRLDKGDNKDTQRVQWDHFINMSSPVEARYIRIVVSSVDTGHVAGISNIEVFGEEAEEWMIDDSDTSLTLADISTYFNEDGFSYSDNRMDGNFDDHGNTYPAERMKGMSQYDGVKFQLGSLCDGANNMIGCANQTIDLPEGSYSSIWFMGAAADSSQEGNFRINYTDGTSSQAKIKVSDWTANNSFYVVHSFAYNHSQTDDVYADTDAACNTYVYALILKDGKTVKSLQLPDNSKIKVFAVSLLGKTEEEPMVPQMAVPPVPEGKKTADESTDTSKEFTLKNAETTLKLSVQSISDEEMRQPLYLSADVNKDGVVNTDDVLMILQEKN